jgi:hypothetical protein
MNETALFIVGAVVTAFGVAGSVIYGRLVFERWSREQDAVPIPASDDAED